jgi:hypothetical protein
VIASADRPRVVFLSDSITENWALADPSFFASDLVCRGIGGQTTAQLVLRVYPDVVALEPDAVHIMAGRTISLPITDPQSIARLCIVTVGTSVGSPH